VVRHDPTPQRKKTNQVLLALGLTATATFLIFLFTTAFVLLKRYARCKAKDKFPAKNGPIEMVDLEAVPTKSPYPERDNVYPSGYIGSSRTSRASIGEPSRSYVAYVRKNPCEDVEQVAHFQMVVEEGKREFVEVPLGENAKGKGRSIGTKVPREKVWWGV
jgi:hypothetical protein